MEGVGGDGSRDHCISCCSPKAAVCGGIVHLFWPSPNYLEFLSGLNILKT